MNRRLFFSRVIGAAAVGLATNGRRVMSDEDLDDLVDASETRRAISMHIMQPLPMNHVHGIVTTNHAHVHTYSVINGNWAGVPRESSAFVVNGQG